MRTILRLLIRLHPRAFRDRFGEELAEQVDRDLDRAGRSDRRALLGCALSNAADLTTSAIRERLNPTWVDTRKTSQREREYGMRMRDGWNDLKTAVRSLGRAPGFAVVAVGTLGLALGALAAIYTVVSTVLLDPLPFEDTDRLVAIAASAPGSDFPEEFGVSTEFLVQYAEEADMLDGVALRNRFTNTLRVGDRAERIWMSSPTGGVFATLGATPMMGRLPAPGDESTVVLSHRLWTTWFGSDPNIVGRTIDAGGAMREVIAVMGPDFWFPDDRILLWLPWYPVIENITPGRFGNRMVARMAPGVTIPGLTEQLRVVASRLPERFGGSPGYVRLMERHRPVVRPLDEELLGDVRGPLWMMMGAFGIVLLIACANVANLFVVRGERRHREFAVRQAMGAGRSPLVRLQMAEVSVVAALSVVVATVVAWTVLPVFIRTAPTNVPRLSEATLGLSTVGFILVAAAVSALVCGLIPALRASAPRLSSLRDGGRGSTGRRHWGRNALVVAQTALALMLLIGSGLLLESFQKLRNVDPGYEIADRMTFQIAPEAEHLTDGPSFADFHMSFATRVAALPGVESVGLVENVPLNEGVGSTRYLTEETAAAGEPGSISGRTWAGPGYFSTMGIEVVRGREFTEADHTSELGNVIVSETTAELLWPGVNPLGRRLTQRDSDDWATVVGVVEDVLQYGFRDDPQPLVYFPLVGPTPDAWRLSSPAYVVKSERADELAPEIRALVTEIAPGTPMYRVFTMEGLAAESMERLSFTMLTLGATAVLALLLGTIGLYGVLSYVVAERTREIGVRMALGADARRVLANVVRQGVGVVFVGVLIGAAFALGTTRVLGTLLYDVEAIDAETFLGMSLTMMLVGVLASYVPARRAASVDPVESMRGE